MNNKLMNLDAKIGDEDAQLPFATETGCVENLITAGADINCSDDKNRYTSLHYAAEKGCFQMMQALLQKGADIQAKTERGETPLILAISNRHTDIVELLINAGADINCPMGSNNYTVLHHASQNGWLDIVRTLIQKGADVQVKTKDGDTSLILAMCQNWTRQNQREIVKLLINAGADVNCCGGCNNYTVLQHAIQNGLGNKVIATLLEKGASIDAKSGSGKTALQIAYQCCDQSIVEQLINAGADATLDKCDPRVTISKILNWGVPGIKILRQLIKSGAYLKPCHYKYMMIDSSLKEHILQDAEISSQAIINAFNHKDLPELYKLPMVRKILPNMENLKIRKNSSLVPIVLESVNREIQKKKHCNVLKTCPFVLKMLAVRSFLSYANDINNRDSIPNLMKRSAEFDYDNPHSSKMICYK